MSADPLDLAGVADAFTPLSAATRATIRVATGPRILEQHPVSRTDGLTEAAHAERFAREYGGAYRFDHRRHAWLIWDGRRWADDTTGECYRSAVELARNLYLGALNETSADRRQAIAEWAIRAESHQRIKNTLALASHLPPLADKGDLWNADPFLLNTPTGLVDLRTGHCRDSRPEDRLTFCTRAPYDPTAPCARWLRFLEEVFAGDPDLIRFIHAAVGYSLTGSTREQVLVICHGAGANGKGSFLNTLADLLGDYSWNMPFSTVEQQQRTSTSNDVAALHGRRFVIASETNDGTRLNEARIKALTGCDPMTARFLYSELFTFRPVGKFWLAVNHKPVVRDDSYGFWRRVRLVPFLRTFPVCATLADELYAEASGILRWAVEGCLAWQRDGLVVPSAVITATGDYQAENDVLADFLEECCDLSPHVETKPADLYAQYTRWADARGLVRPERLSLKSFGLKVKARYQETRSGGVRRYLGVAPRQGVPDVS